MIHYQSTRGSRYIKTSAQAIIQGIAEDKGLYVPNEIPIAEHLLKTSTEIGTTKEVEVNNICNDYKEYYETIVNVYFNDINKVNGFIDSYNSEYSKNLERYNSDLVTDYIDYNKDGKYLERVDSNE